MGCRITAVSDSNSGVVSNHGLDIARLMEYKQVTRTVAALPNTEPVANENILTLDCDILIPSALEGQITADNAKDISARIVFEGANGPTTPEADAVLGKKGVVLVPDVLENAGGVGVAVSYFEWVQDLQAFFWTEAEVSQKPEEIMPRSFGEVLRTSRRREVNMRTAAYILAVDKVARATQIRRIYP